MNLDKFLGYFDFTYDLLRPEDDYALLRQRLIEDGDLDPALRDKVLIALVDLQGANLGNIDRERYPLEAKSAARIVDRMDSYIEDSVVSEFEDALNRRGVDSDRMSLGEMVRKCREMGVGEGEVCYGVAEAAINPDSVYIEELQGREAAHRLASALDEFANEYDYYEYFDRVDNKEDSIAEVEEALMAGSADEIKGYLREFIYESSDEAAAKAAAALESRINLFLVAQEAISVSNKRQPLEQMIQSASDRAGRPSKQGIDLNSLDR